jgi:hypothetical protein
MMAQPIRKQVAGVPMAALEAITDPNTREVLRALVDAHHVRNGQAGDGAQRFVTAQELGLVKGQSALNTLAARLGVAGGGGAANPANAQGGMGAQALANLINQLQAQILESALFKDLGSKLALLDHALIDEITQRSNAIVNEANARIAALLAEATARGTAITEERTLRETAQASLAQSINEWSAVTGRNVAALQTEVTARTDAISAEATERITLAARVGGAESGIGTLISTTATIASSATVLQSRVNQTESTVSNLSSSSADHAQAISQLTTRTSGAEAGLASEQDTRLAQDNLIASAVQTIWAALGGNAGLIQGGASISVNLSGAVASQWNQVQAALKDGSGNLIASAAIKQTTQTLVDRQGQIESKWVINLDSGGNALGYRQAGFGISGSSSADGPQYAFGVQADQFWIAAPGDAAQSSAPAAKLPFIVKTTPWIDGQGVSQPPGVYLNELFATSAKIGRAQINSAMIGEAQVSTLHIGNNAVTVPFTQTFPGETAGQGVNTALAVASGTIMLDAPAMVFASCTGLIAYGQGWVTANSNLVIDGSIVSFGGGAEAWVNAAHSGGKYVDAGPFPRTVTVVLNFLADPRARMISPTIFIMGAKR